MANFPGVLMAVWGYVTKDAVTLFTLVLAASTIWLALSTRGLWKETRRGGDTAAKLADVAEKQLLIQGLQTDIQKKQHAMGRLQFLAQHRPRIIIRAIRGPEQRDYYAKAVAGDTRQKMRWLLVILVNIGGSDAEITQFAADYRTISDLDRGSLDPLPFGTARLDPAVPITLRAGEQRVFEIISGSMKLGTAYVGDEVASGRISYSDGAGVVRATAFSRTRNRTDGKFAVSRNPEEEYAD